MPSPLFNRKSPDNPTPPPLNSHVTLSRTEVKTTMQDVEKRFRGSKYKAKIAEEAQFTSSK